MGEGIDEIAVGVLRQPLQGHRTACGIADQALQLIAAMRWNLGMSVERKAVHTGTLRTGEPGRLALIAKAGTNAPDLLASPLAIGDALLYGGGHGTGECRLVVEEGIIPGGHGVSAARLQVFQVT